MNVEPINENINIVGHLALTQITTYARKLGASKENPFIVCMDSKPSWRHDYYLENRHKFPDLYDQKYKGKRPIDTTLPWDDIYRVTNAICKALEENSDILVLKIDKCEADDIIAVLAKRIAGVHWICSGDKDFVQLQSPNVKVYDPLKKAFKVDQDVELYKKIHIMIGDTTDNIPAIKPRMKEKTAIKFLPKLEDELKINPLMRLKWEFNENLICFNKIPDYIAESIIEEYNKQSFNYNAMKLIKSFMPYGLEQHTQNIINFKLPDTEVKTITNQTFIESARNADISRSNLEDFFS